MPKFAANLSFLFQELEFLDRFEAARRAGFQAVEYLFPYDLAPAAEIAARLDDNGLTQALFNLAPGDWDAGERGLTALPGRQDDFRRSVDNALRYADALRLPSAPRDGRRRARRRRFARVRGGLRRKTSPMRRTHSGAKASAPSSSR